MLIHGVQQLAPILPHSSTTKFVHEENWMANVKRFSIETIQGMVFWKKSG